MRAVAQIVEMDQERDRRTCVSLDLKVTGANRELARWIADHSHHYPPSVIAGWLGCGETRVKDLRRWAEQDFDGKPFRPGNQRRARADASLKTNDNSESGDEFDPQTGEIIESDIASPEVLEDNILHVIGGMNENARVFNKLLRLSAFDREAVARINTAIDRMMGKWRSVQSTLEKKG